MKKKEISDLTVLASTALLLCLIVFLSTALVATAQSDSSTIYAYITNSVDNTVSVIDTATNTVTATVPVGIDPYGVAVNPDGSKVYVTNNNSNTVSVIDTETNTVIATVEVEQWPWGIAVSPDGTKAYVTNFLSNNVSVIDTTTNTVTATVTEVGTGSYGVAVNPAGTRAYVTNWDNIVSVIDTATNTVISKVPVGKSPVGVAVTPDGKKVYVANGGSNTTSVIDTATNTVIATVNVGNHPNGVAINPSGTKVYVANKFSDNLSIIDTSTDTVTASIYVSDIPEGITVTPDGTKVYVVNFYENTVSIIDTATNTVTATVPVGKSPVAFGQFISSKTTTTPEGEQESEGSSHSNSDGGGTGGSPEPQENVESKDTTRVFIPNEKPVCFNFTNDVTVVESISFESKKTMPKTTAIVENLKNKSTLVSELPKDITVYKYFNVWVGNAGYGYSDNIQNASICFKVNNTWIQATDINQSSIILKMYDKENKEWTECPVTIADEDNIVDEDKDCLYFTANIPGFYSFAITGTDQKTEEERPQIPSETKAVEGNESTNEKENSTEHSYLDTLYILGFAIVVLCIIGYLLYSCGIIKI